MASTFSYVCHLSEDAVVCRGDQQMVVSPFPPHAGARITPARVFVIIRVPMKSMRLQSGLGDGCCLEDVDQVITLAGREYPALYGALYGVKKILPAL